MSMNILFDEVNNVFTLENNQITYQFFINKKRYLQHLYFGKRINKFDYQQMTDLQWDWSKTYLNKLDEEKIYDDNYYNDRSLMELPIHGQMDKRGGSVIIKNELGSLETEFKYISHIIYDGKTTLDTLPSTHGNNEECKTLELKLIEINNNVELILSYTIFKDLSIIARNAKLLNSSDKLIKLTKASTICLDLPTSDYDLIHFHGDWCLERFVQRKKLGDLKTVVESNFGRSSHEQNPFIIICNPNCNENTGEAIAFSLVYSGNFKAELNVNKWKSLRVIMGINDEDFEFMLKPNDKFEFPEGILVYSNEGLNSISHNIHDLIRNNLIKYKDAKKYRPILFNSWEGCYLDFNTTTILEYMVHARNIGAELFVLDDGWFGRRDDDSKSLGDWFVNDKKIDLNIIIKKCHELGMKFGIWFEPEMINVDSELYRKHPEYAIGSQDKERTLSRHQLVLDTTNDEALDAIYHMMCEVLDKYDIDYIKWDHNRNIGEINSSCYYGETYHRIIVGTYKLLTLLQERYPTIFFEGCASGGGRFDLGMLYYNPQIWCSDETDPIQRLFIQYGTSYGYPLSTIGAHISKSKMTNYLTKAHIAMFGTYGIEMNPCNLSLDEKENIIKVNDIYHKHHNEIVQNGDLYRLYSPFESNYMSMISVSKNKLKALVLFVNILKENNRYRFLKLKGLDANKKYKNSYDNQIYYGDYYMNVGLNLTRWLDEFSSFLILLEAV